MEKSCLLITFTQIGDRKWTAKNNVTGLTEPKPEDFSGEMVESPVLWR
jgi:hypothetical protein